MYHLHPVARFSEVAADLFGNHHGTMLASSAAETDGQIALPFFDVVRQQINQKIGDTLDKLARLRKRANVFSHARISSGERAEFGHEMRIGEKAHVEEQIGIDGDPVLIAERDDREDDVGAPRVVDETISELAAKFH